MTKARCLSLIHSFILAAMVAMLVLCYKHNTNMCFHWYRRITKLQYNCKGYSAYTKFRISQIIIIRPIIEQTVFYSFYSRIRNSKCLYVKISYQIILAFLGCKLVYRNNILYTILVLFFIKLPITNIKNHNLSYNIGIYSSILLHTQYKK